MSYDNRVVNVLAFCLGRLEAHLGEALDIAERGGVAAIGRAASIESTRTPLAAFVRTSGGVDPRDRTTVATNNDRLATLATTESYQRSKGFSQWDQPWFFVTQRWVVSQEQQFSVLQVSEDVAQTIWRVAVCRYIAGPVDDLLPELDGLVPGVSAESALESGSRILNQIGQLTFYESDRQEVTYAPSRHYLYAGPIDRDLRPFCRELVGKVFTGDDIAAMKNDAGLDVFWTGGGWGCRHLWLPVSEFGDQVEWARTAERDPWVEEQLKGLDRVIVP